jgi:hypothetical protein
MVALAIELFLNCTSKKGADVELGGFEQMDSGGGCSWDKRREYGPSTRLRWGERMYLAMKESGGLAFLSNGVQSI